MVDKIQPRESPFRPPTDQEISAAEQRLGIKFHPDYRDFLRGGCDVGDSILEPALITPDAGHLDLFKIADAAWTLIHVPRALFPFVEDNGDYYCLTQGGEVIFWSHNGTTNEKWANIATWKQQMIEERHKWRNRRNST